MPMHEHVKEISKLTRKKAALIARCKALDAEVKAINDTIQKLAAKLADAA